MSKIIFLVCITMGFYATAQSGRYEISARNAAIGGTSATINDAYSGYYNPAGLATYSEGPTVLAGYQNRFGISDLSSIGFGLVLPQSFGTFSIMANRFGLADYYNEQRAGLAFGNKIGFVSLGGSINYVQYSIETVGTRSMVSIDFGGSVDITKKLLFGSYIRNINQAKLQEFTDERLPTLFVVGFSYKASEALLLSTEIEKDLNFREIIKIGLEYKVAEFLYLRTGIRTQPREGTFGFGLKPNRFLIDYAYITTSALGDRHELSIAYTIKKND
jgi:hypothetical protein